MQSSPEPESVPRLFLRSSGAAALSQGLRVFSVLGAQFLLRRWIPPEDWGLFQWAMVVFLVLGAVRDLGLVHHVLRVEPRPWGNLLAVELIWGGMLAALALILAPAGSQLFAGSHDSTVNVLRCLAVFLFFEGLAAVPKVWLEGELKVGRAVMPELWRSLIFVAVALGLARQGHGVMSLALGQTAGAIYYAAALWWRVRGEVPLRWQRGRMAGLLLESMPLSAIWFLGILIRHVDPLVLGLRFPFADLGHYTFAFDWANLASGLILLPAITRVLFPALVRLRSDTEAMFRAYSLSTLFVLAVEVPAAFFLFLNADLVVRIVGGGQWGDAPTYLRILCFVPLVDPFSRLGGEVLKTLHRDRLWILASFSSVLVLIFGGYGLTGLWGPSGMAWIHLVAPGGLFLAWGLWQTSPTGFRRLLRDLARVYLVPIPLFVLAWLVAGAGALDDADPLRFGLSLLAGAASVLLAWRHFGSDFVAFFRGGRGEERGSAGGGSAAVRGAEDERP